MCCVVKDLGFRVYEFNLGQILSRCCGAGSMEVAHRSHRQCCWPQGTQVNEIVVKPRPLNPAFFSDRIEGVDNATSAAMYNALLTEGCINSTGYLVENPRWDCLPPLGLSNEDGMPADSDFIGYHLLLGDIRCTPAMRLKLQMRVYCMLL